MERHYCFKKGEKKKRHNLALRVGISELSDNPFLASGRFMTNTDLWKDSCSICEPLIKIV